MSESRSSLVDCPVCGEEFDPTDAGGWCTNSECGEWQYIGDEVPEPSVDAGEVGAAPDGPDLMKGEGDADGEPGATDDEAVDPDDGSADETATAAEETPRPAITKAAAAESDPDRGSAEPTPDGATDATEPDGAADAASGGDDASTCPDCSTAIDPDDNFCAACGADLEAVPEPSTLESCPSCDTDVAADDSFCAACGEDLDAAREAVGGGSGTDATADTEATGAGADEGANADTGVGAEAAETSDGATEAPEAPESLALRVRGEEIAVTDDETVGREVRRVLTQSGAEEDQAVRIHREHLRFVREAGQFYVVDLGDNPTRLNGTRLSKGDREPVDPGDEIELSGVATLSVESP